MAIHVIDIGNTRLKWGVFNGDTLTERRIFQSTDEWRTFASTLPEGQPWVAGTVGLNDKWMGEILERPEIFHAHTGWNLPIDSAYETMPTLGVDRLAAVCGAHARYDGASLIFDAGTCLTIDFLDDDGLYQGGNISPGWQMRMKAMNEGTENLPLVAKKSLKNVLGTSTEAALQGGGFHGYVFEIQGYVRHFRRMYADLNVLLTGGDAYELAKYLKLEIFVEPDLVLYGLHEMYKTHYD